MPGFGPIADSPVASDSTTTLSDVIVSEQHAYSILTATGEFVSDQYAYAVILHTPVPPTRRQALLGSF